MNTSLDCLPCLYKQALYTSKLCTKSINLQRKVLQQVSILLNNLDLSLSPPENSIAVYNTIARICDCYDPFADLKRKGNQVAISMSTQTRKQIYNTKDPLFTAILFALAGNIIDYGSHQNFDIDETMSTALINTPIINDYNEFCDDLQNAQTILFLGDNCGELVFDGLLIEQFSKKVFFAVKETPIINDALFEDAVLCGLDKMCTIISNGTNCPGTPVNLCSQQFLEIFNSADMIISKGQGNYETLSDCDKPIYFLLTVKCPIVGRHVAEISGHPGTIQTGETVLIQS